MIGKRAIALGLATSLMAGAASAQFPSVKDLPRSLPGKGKSSGGGEKESRSSSSSGGKEERSGRGGAAPADPSAKYNRPARASQGITGPLHQKYLGQVVFTKADRAMDAISEADITRDFSVTDDIFFRVYVDKPGLAIFEGQTADGVDLSRKWMHVRYRVVFTIGGQSFDVFMKHWGGMEEHESWTTWRGQFLTDEIGLPGSEAFAEFLSRADRKGLIKPGRNQIEVTIVPTLSLTNAYGTGFEKLRAEPVARGAFNLTVGPGGIPKRDKRICGFQRAGSMPPVEQQILSYARSIWTKPSAPPVEVRLTHASWTINRHPLSGAVVSRRIDAAIVGRHAEYCEIQGYAYTQPSAGGSFSAAGQKFTGAEAVARYIPCSCIG